MGTFTNCEDPDEMPHDAAFHQGLHCLFLVKKVLPTKELQDFLKILTRHP